MAKNENTNVRLLGSLRSTGETGVVRVEDAFDADIDDVWSALTDPKRRAHWMGEVDGDISLGSEFRQRVFASGWEGTVRVVEFEAPLHLRMIQTADEARVPVIEVEETLRAEGNRTVLVVEARGMPTDLLYAYGTGWQLHVEDLGAHLKGRERCDADARWNELEPLYAELASSIS